MKQKILYGLGALIIVAAICQNEIFILLQSMPEEVKESVKTVALLEDRQVRNMEAYDAAAPEQEKVEPIRVVAKVETPTKKTEKKTKTEAAPIADKKFKRSEIVKLNGKTYQGLEDELLACVAFVENYSATSYYCGARWTIGYGTTGYANGERVQPGQHISQEEAKACVRAHFRNYVFPVIDEYVERELSENEMLATCLFIYNIGGGNFTKNGSCAFLTAINNNATPEECARKMTQFYRSAGKKSNGLLKRRWVEGALFCGYITAEDIKNLTPGGFYNADLSEYYASMSLDRDGFYSYKLDDETVNRFLEKNRGYDLSVVDII